MQYKLCLQFSFSNLGDGELEYSTVRSRENDVNPGERQQCNHLPGICMLPSFPSFYSLVFLIMASGSLTLKWEEARQVQFWNKRITVLKQNLSWMFSMSVCTSKRDPTKRLSSKWHTTYNCKNANSFNSALITVRHLQAQVLAAKLASKPLKITIDNCISLPTQQKCYQQQSYRETNNVFYSCVTLASFVSTWHKLVI